jgi:hypothetical protein
MSANETIPAGPPHSLSRWLSLLVLGCALVVAVGVRVRLLDIPLERDEGGFAYIGQLVLEGIPPYQLAGEIKVPGIYLAYAAMMSAFAQTPAGIHFGLLLVHLATLAVLFLIARKLLDLQGAAFATAAYALMTLSPSCLGLAAHATHFVLLPGLLGLWVLLRLEKKGRWFHGLAGGCLIGVAFLMKQHGLFFGFFGGLYLAWLCVANKTAWGGRGILALLGSYSAGFLLPLLAVCLWLKIAGVFPKFWFWTVTYPLAYKDTLPLRFGFQNARLALGGIIHAAPLLWIFVGLGLVCLCLTRLARGVRVFLAGLLVFSFLAVCPGLYFRQHYFILWLPAVALLAGLAVSWSGRRLAELQAGPWLRHLPMTLAAIACAQSLQADRLIFFSFSPVEACYALYGPENPFTESLNVADHIEQDTRADQRVAVIGSEPEIYFYARRHSATSQIYVYPLMEPQPLARQMQEAMITDIEQNPPEYLVFASFPSSWLFRPDSDYHIMDWMEGYVKQHMRRVGLIQFTGPATTEEVWGPEAAAAALRSQNFFAVYKAAAPP